MMTLAIGPSFRRFFLPRPTLSRPGGRGRQWRSGSLFQGVPQ